MSRINLRASIAPPQSVGERYSWMIQLSTVRCDRCLRPGIVPTMKTAALAVGLALLAAPAFAQDKPPAPAYVPIVLTQDDLKDLQKFLDDQPFKFSSQIINWITELERRAVAKKAAEAAPPKPD